jgi:hypothetical protein
MVVRLLAASALVWISALGCTQLFDIDPGTPRASAGAAGSDTGGTAGLGGGQGSGGSESSAGAMAGDSGIAGSAGTATADFPGTPILDDFNRPDGDPGASWLGSNAFSIVGEELSCEDCQATLIWTTRFGENQEAYATLSGFGFFSAEINLVLKAQGWAFCDLIEVLYDPAMQEVHIEYCNDSQWTYLEPTPVQIEPGDRLGGRAHADGTIEIFINEVSVASVDASAYPHATGFIGVNGLAIYDPNRWDDFGGGNYDP